MLNACRGGSRGYRRPLDITPKITRTGRVGAGATAPRAARVLRAGPPNRAPSPPSATRNLRYVQTAASASMRSSRCAAPAARSLASLRAPLRGASCAPSMACSPTARSVVARGLRLDSAPHPCRALVFWAFSTKICHPNYSPRVANKESH